MTYAPKGRSSQRGGPALRRALTEDADAWLTELLGDAGPGVALVAVGGYGRGDLAPGSDLDVVCVHEKGRDVAGLAEKVWYAIWDAGIGLDHSVRTVDEALAVAADDIKAALGLLDVRHVAGDAALAATLREQVLGRWRATAGRRLPELREMATVRASAAGELAFLLEPDLKESRGGLRDALVPWQVAAAQLADAPPAEVRAAIESLRDVRGALHAVALAGDRRPSDRLLLQEQDAVAAHLGYADADALMAVVAAAGRTIAWSMDATWRRVAALTDATPQRRRFGRRIPGPVREPLADGVVKQGGEVVLAREADTADPSLALRVARAAADSGLPIAPYALARLLDEGSAPGEPWPAPVRDAFLALLGAGHAAVPVIETLDSAGLWERYLPWWPRVRSKPQRNSFHRFTVDRHLLEAVAEAAPQMRDVGRPDLLLMGALLHDVGKGWPGDHTEVGVTLVPPEMRRLGFTDADAADVATLVRHHLLLAETATRRDLDDPATVLLVARSVGRREVLQLLRGLTEADSIATGPAMWSDWKRGLLDQLTRRAAAVLGGEDPPPGRVLSDSQRALLGATEMQLLVTTDGEVTIASPDQPGLLAAFAGVLALHRQEIRGLEAYTEDGAALSIAATAPQFGSPPDWGAVRDDVRRSLAGTLDVAAELAKRAAAYPVSRSAELLAAAPKALWLDDVSDRASVVELRAPDAMGLLARVAFALTLTGLQVVNARCSTLGVEVVDAFYVTEADGALVTDPGRRATIAKALESAASA